MALLQKYCANCGKRTKNTGGWRYSPIFCSIQCENEHEEKHRQRLKDDPKYATEYKRASYFTGVYLILFGVIPILVLVYAIFFT